MKWISVKKKLPKLTEPLMWYNEDNKKVVCLRNYKATVLAYQKKIGIFKAELTRRGWSEIASHLSNSAVKPTHWMPLPKPPIK